MRSVAVAPWLSHHVPQGRLLAHCTHFFWRDQLLGIILWDNVCSPVAGRLVRPSFVVMETRRGRGLFIQLHSQPKPCRGEHYRRYSAKRKAYYYTTTLVLAAWTSPRGKNVTLHSMSSLVNAVARPFRSVTLLTILLLVVLSPLFLL